MPKYLNSEQRAKLNQKKISVELTIFEAELVRFIRNVEYGEAVVKIEKGIPHMAKVTKNHIFFVSTSGAETLQKIQEENV